MRMRIIRIWAKRRWLGAWRFWSMLDLHTHTCIYIYIIIMIYIYICVYIYIFAQIQSESNMAHIFSNFEVRCQLVFIPGKSSFFICMYIYIHTLTSFNHQVYLLISCHQLRSTKKCISWTHMVSIRKQQHIFWLSRQINIILCLRLSRNDSVTNKILTPKYFPMTAIFDGEIFMFDCQFTLSTSRNSWLKHVKASSNLISLVVQSVQSPFLMAITCYHHPNRASQRFLLIHSQCSSPGPLLCDWRP